MCTFCTFHNIAALGRDIHYSILAYGQVRPPPTKKYINTHQQKQLTIYEITVMYFVATRVPLSYQMYHP